MTTTPTRVAITISTAEDSRAMCFRQGKACVYASAEGGRIIITQEPGGVVESLDTRTGEITDSGPTAANADGTGHQPPIPSLISVIGGNGAGKTTWCRQHPHELPEVFYNPDAIAQDLGDWNGAGNQRDAGRIVNAAIRRHLKQREDFGFESTYSGRSRPRIVRTAASNGYEVRAVFIGTTGPEIYIERVRQRVRFGTGHDVPVAEITRRWFAVQKNLPRRLRRSGPSMCWTTATVRRDTSRASRRAAQVAGYPNALGADRAPTDRTARPSHVARIWSSDEGWGRGPYNGARWRGARFASAPAADVTLLRPAPETRFLSVATS